MGRERTASTVLAPLLFLGGAIGSLVHAIVATAWSPALWPARWFIELQATWDDGRYSPKVTWALTWFHEIAVLAMAGVLVAGAARLVEARRLVSPEPPAGSWEPLERRSPARGAAVGALLIAAPAGVLALAATAPELLTPVSFLAILLLIVGPFAAIAGLVLLVDGLAPPEMHVGAVEDRAIVQGQGSSAPEHRVRVQGRSFQVTAATHDELGPGTWIRVEIAAVSGRVLGLDRRRTAYRG